MECILFVSNWIPELNIEAKIWHAFACIIITLKNKQWALTLSAVSLSVSHWQDRGRTFRLTAGNGKNRRKARQRWTGTYNVARLQRMSLGKTTHTSMPLMLSIVTQSNQTLHSNAKARELFILAALRFSRCHTIRNKQKVALKPVLQGELRRSATQWSRTAEM